MTRRRRTAMRGRRMNRMTERLRRLDFEHFSNWNRRDDLLIDNDIRFNDRDFLNEAQPHHRVFRGLVTAQIESCVIHNRVAHTNVGLGVDKLLKYAETSDNLFRFDR